MGLSRHDPGRCCCSGECCTLSLAALWNYTLTVPADTWGNCVEPPAFSPGCSIMNEETFLLERVEGSCYWLAPFPEGMCSGSMPVSGDIGNINLYLVQDAEDETKCRWILDFTFGVGERAGWSKLLDRPFTAYGVPHTLSFDSQSGIFCPLVNMPDLTIEPVAA